MNSWQLPIRIFLIVFKCYKAQFFFSIAWILKYIVSLNSGVFKSDIDCGMSSLDWFYGAYIKMLL